MKRNRAAAAYLPNCKCLPMDCVLSLRDLHRPLTRTFAGSPKDGDPWGSNHGKKNIWTRGAATLFWRSLFSGSPETERTAAEAAMKIGIGSVRGSQ